MPYPKQIKANVMLQQQPLITSAKMSYQKKSLILQQIQQAIRKKAQQKSRTKQQVGRVLQNSIQKKKNIMRTTNTKDQKVLSTHKNENYQQFQKNIDKHVSLFNNQQLTTLEGDLKLKKYNNRRLDKLVSLIQYMVSSSEKAIKYISSTNFQAEFALKLYRSDKQNLLNQLKNLTIQDFIESYRANQKAPSQKNDLSYNLLIEQNTKLKKDLMILQKESQRYVKGPLQQKQPSQLKAVQKQVVKLKETVRKLIPFQSFRKYMEILQKQTKFESIVLKCQQNSKKVAEIEIVIASLQAERNNIIQNIIRARGDPKSQRSAKMNQIHGQKQQLQKQIGSLKSRISQMKQSSKLLEQYEILKRSSEFINQKLSTLANELSDGNYYSSKRNSQTLIDFIKIKTKDYAMFYRKQSQQVQSLLFEREELQLLIKEKDEQLVGFQQRMQNIHAEVQNLRQDMEQANKDKAKLIEKLRTSQSLLENRQSQIAIISQKLKASEYKDDSNNDIKTKNNQLRRELQSIVKRNQEKQKWLKDKINILETQKLQVQDKLMQLQVFLSHKNEQIEQLIREKQSQQESTEVIVEKLKIQSRKQIGQLKETNQSLQNQIQNQTFKYQKLLQTYQESNQYYKVLTESYNQKHQRIKQLQEQLNQSQKTIQEMQDLNRKISKSNQQNYDAFERIKQLQLQNKNLENEKERVRKENQIINQKQRITQQQVIKNTYSLEEFSNTKNLNTRLNQSINNFKRELQLKNLEYNQIKTHCYSLQEAIQILRQKDIQKQNEIISLQQAKKSLQHIIQQKSKHYQLQISSLNKKLQQHQLEISNVNRERKQIHEFLSMQRGKNEKLSDRLGISQSDMEELRSEMRSLTIISNQITAQKQHLQEHLNYVQDQNGKLKDELEATKQQLQDHAQITKSKTIQYVYLLRQILKGINIQTSGYHHIQSFQELLQFGSKQVVQMRKRLRQQQSNRRRNNKRDEEYNFIDDSDSPRLQDLKTKLFHMGVQQISPNPTQEHFNEEKNETTGKQKLQLNQFQDMMSQKANDSMISQENKLNLQQFDDLKSQKMNNSMVSNTQQDQYLDKNSLLEDNAIKKYANIATKVQQNEEKQKQIFAQDDIQKKLRRNLFEMSYKPKIISQVAQINQIQSKISTIPYNSNTASVISGQSDFRVEENHINKKSIEKSYSSSKPNLQLNIQQYQQVNSEEESAKSEKQLIKKQSKQKSEVQLYVAKSNSSDVAIYPLQKQLKQGQNKPSSQIQDNSGADFDQFNQMNSGMNQSMTSEKGQNRFSIIQLPVQHMNQYSQSNKNQEGQEGLGIDQFGQVKNEQMNDSMLSEKEQDKQHGLSDFGDFKEQAINRSVLSQKEHGLSQFGDFKEEGMNQSMLSEKEHGLSEFGDLNSEQMNHSMLSQHQKTQEHGLSEFGELGQQNLANDSIISQQKKSFSNANSQENAGNNIDDFDQIKSDKMSDSILSEK